MRLEERRYGVHRCGGMRVFPSGERTGCRRSFTGRLLVIYRSGLQTSGRRESFVFRYFGPSRGSMLASRRGAVIVVKGGGRGRRHLRRARTSGIGTPESVSLRGVRSLAIGSDPRTHNYTLAERVSERVSEGEAGGRAVAVRKEETSMATSVSSTRFPTRRARQTREIS